MSDWLEHFFMFVGFCVVVCPIFVFLCAVIHIHWLMIICWVNYVILIDKFPNYILTDEAANKPFPKTKACAHLFLRLWKMPWEASRVSGVAGDNHWEFFPGLWPNVKVNGVKI